MIVFAHSCDFTIPRIVQLTFSLMYGLKENGYFIKFDNLGARCDPAGTDLKEDSITEDAAQASAADKHVQRMQKMEKET